MNQSAAYIAQLGREAANIIDTAGELIYYMRGGLSYTEVMNMSAGEREAMANMINRAMKNAKDDSRTVIAL
jgi:endo-1,4-beta-D-glucanase Y